MNQNFRTLNLAIEFYRCCEMIKLPYFLKNQLLRAASSIALNLSEGRGRQSSKDQKRFFNIALGSLRECQTVIILANKKNSELYRKSDGLGAHLYKLIKNLK